MNKIYELIDRLWQWIAEKVFVRFDFHLPVEAIRQSNASGRVVFALTSGGIIEWLILSSWCRSQGMGAILVTNRRRILLLSKPKYFFQILFGRRSFSDLFLSDEPGPRLLFSTVSERKKLFVPTPAEKILCELYSATSSAGQLGWFTFVPIFFLWRKHMRGAARKPSEYLFGLGSNPNLIGKIWYLARRRKDSSLTALCALHLAAKEGEGAVEGMDETEAMRAAKSMRRRILVLTHQEMRVVLGPRFHSPYSVKETLMRDPDIQALITRISTESGVDRKKVMQIAYRNLTEIVSNYNFRFIEVMYACLTWLFNKVFDGLVARNDEFQRLREILKNKPVVFVPCHRSHLDYLVIPYVLFLHDIVTPHIAAGINLAFWPMGYLLRRGGAFFIRRSFRGDPLYGLCLKKYLEYLIKNRYNVMFFIEGTRSRSGKMLAPAYGMLKMTLETYRRKQCDDIALVPVSICYDEVPEQGSYTKELVGGQKVKESATTLLKSRRLVQRNIGKVYVRLGEPVFARTIVSDAAHAGLDDTLLLQKTAFQLCKDINDITPITPKSLVSSIFLAHVLDSISLEEILRLSLMLGKYVLWSGLPMSVDLDPSFRRAIEQTVRRLQKSGVVSMTEGVPRLFNCENRKRVLLNFYKNNAIHCLVTPAILLLSFFRTLRTPGKTPEDFHESVFHTALWLRNALKFEFFFNPTPAFVDELHRNVDFFFGKGEWRSRPSEEWVSALKLHFEEWNDVSVYLRLTGDLLESYLTVARFVQEASAAQVEKKALVQRIVKYAETKALQGGIAFPESISVQNYSNALQLLENLKFVAIVKESEKSMVQLPAADRAGVDQLAEELSAFLDLMAEKPENIVSPETRLVLETLEEPAEPVHPPH